MENEGVTPNISVSYELAVQSMAGHDQILQQEEPDQSKLNNLLCSANQDNNLKQTNPSILK